MDPFVTFIFDGVGNFVVGVDRRVKFDADTVVAADPFVKGEVDGVVDGVVDSRVDVLDVCRLVPFDVVVGPLGIAGVAFASCEEGVDAVPDADTVVTVDPFVKGEVDGVVDGVVDSRVDVLDVCRLVPFDVVVGPLGIAGVAFASCEEGVDAVPDADTVVTVDPFVKGEVDGVVDGVADSCVDVLDVCRLVPFDALVDPSGIAGVALASCVDGFDVVPDTFNAVVDPFV